MTDKNPPKLVKYDRWGHDVSEVIIPESAQATKRDLIERGFSGPAFRDAAEAAGIPVVPLTMASGYLLDQAEIGMSCAMGADAGMVASQVAQFAPPDIRQLVLSKLESGEWIGMTGQFFTERTGGSDLGALETTATPDGDAWRSTASSGSRSNLDGEAFVVLAKPRARPTAFAASRRSSCSGSGATAPATASTSASSRTSSARRRSPPAKSSLRTPRQFMLSGDPEGLEAADGGGPSDGRSVSRLMAMTNVARLGVAMMGLGCARRALVESLCYARSRRSWKKTLIDQPLMKPQARRDDRGRRGCAGDPFRRLRPPQPPAPAHQRPYASTHGAQRSPS